MAYNVTEASNLPVEPKEKPCKCPLLFSNHISISRWTMLLSRVIVQIRDTRGHFLLSFSQTERQMPRNCHADIRDCRKPLPLSFRATYAPPFLGSSGSRSCFATLSRSAIDRAIAVCVGSDQFPWLARGRASLWAQRWKRLYRRINNMARDN